MERDRLISLLREKGIGVTEPRIVILEYLRANFTHPSVDRIYRDLLPSHPNLSRTTVYNAVKALSAVGLVQLITIDGEHVKVDGDMRPHAHLLCRRCGKIVDVPVNGLADLRVPDNNGQDGNLIEEARIYFSGLCKQCRKEIQNTGNCSENDIV